MTVSIGVSSGYIRYTMALTNFSNSHAFTTLMLAPSHGNICGTVAASHWTVSSFELLAINAAPLTLRPWKLGVSVVPLSISFKNRDLMASDCLSSITRVGYSVYTISTLIMLTISLKSGLSLFLKILPRCLKVCYHLNVDVWRPPCWMGPWSSFALPALFLRLLLFFVVPLVVPRVLWVSKVLLNKAPIYYHKTLTGPPHEGESSKGLRIDYAVSIKRDRLYLTRWLKYSTPKEVDPYRSWTNQHFMSLLWWVWKVR